MKNPRLSLQGLRILKLLLDAHAAVSGADVVQILGIPTGTTYPILNRFAFLGLVDGAWEKQTAKKLGRPRCRRYHITARGRSILLDALASLA